MSQCRVALIALTALAAAACDETTAPPLLSSTYRLVAVDGRPLPVPFGQDGSLLLAGSLDFRDLDRARSGAVTEGLVCQVQEVRRPDQTIVRTETEYRYFIEGDRLRIDLCPPGSACLVATELAGPIAADRRELRLTHFVAGKPGSVYRFLAGG